MEPTHSGDPTLRLRAEELNLEKSIVGEGAAVVARDLVATNVGLDVPVLVEHVRIDERILTAPYREAAPIDAPQRLIVRLSRERVHVDRTVVEYERVAIGTRAVTETRAVSARLAHEELTVDLRSGERS